MKTEATKTVLIIVLAGLSIFIYLDDICKLDWIPNVCNSDTTISIMGSACDNRGRYPKQGEWVEQSGGGAPIDSVDAVAFIKNFSSTLTGNGIDVLNHGTFISKKVIDSIFANNLYANGLVAYAGLDNQIFTTIYSPARSYHIKSPLHHHDGFLYVSETWCPNVCGFLSNYCLDDQGVSHCEPEPPVSIIPNTNDSEE